ncbi:COG6-domain-containing protein [Paxillus ammoniavirescens]|nr:COG6-domain-containing protein [Paxillus ammoniavirescens]
MPVSAQQHPRGPGLANSEDDDWSDLDTELPTPQERIYEHSDVNETAARRLLVSEEDGPTRAGYAYFVLGYNGEIVSRTGLRKDLPLVYLRIPQENQLERSPLLPFRPKAEYAPDILTRGGPSGHPRPIELHVHDSIRYIGDMFAWVHQAITAE